LLMAAVRIMTQMLRVSAIIQANNDGIAYPSKNGQYGLGGGRHGIFGLCQAASAAVICGLRGGKPEEGGRFPQKSSLKAVLSMPPR